MESVVCLRSVKLDRFADRSFDDGAIEIRAVATVANMEKEAGHIVLSLTAEESLNCDDYSWQAKR